MISAPREGNRALKRLYDADEVDEDNGPTQIKQEHIYNIAGKTVQHLAYF
jgi:hypothetical protein